VEPPMSGARTRGPGSGPGPDDPVDVDAVGLNGSGTNSSGMNGAGTNGAGTNGAGAGTDQPVPENVSDQSRRPGRGNSGQWPVLAAISAGGAIGACARYGAGLLWPTAPVAFPWTTLLVNVVGCAVIGAFMVFITEGARPHPLLRPFFGTGVLGGFTTFSTYAVDIQRLMTNGHAGIGLLYLLLTAVTALGAVWLTAAGTRRLLGWRATR
jgi:fluoride exporter